MIRRRAPLLLLWLAACGGKPPAPGKPAPQAAPPAQSAPGENAAAALIAPPPAPPAASDTTSESPTFDQQVNDFLVRTADSLADARALAALEDARPDSALVEDNAPVPGEAGTTPTTWDIDVVTFNNHDRVQYYLDFFQGPARDRMAIWLERMPRYEPMIRAQMRKQGLPEDMVYLALIESGFSNSAVSRSRAVGMWQFMKGTARLYHLRVDHLVDERRDPYKATEAAARFLAALRDRFGSVYLAAAAYNAGPGRVGRSLKRLPDDESEDTASTNDADFFRLYDTRYIRRETKDYVPKLIAAALIAKQPEKYGFAKPAAGDSLPPDSLIVTGATGLDVVARLADTTLIAIRDLNPQYLTLMTPPGARMIVRVPRGAGPSVQTAWAALPASERVTYIEHTVASGETLGGIAKRYKVSAGTIREANPRLKPTALRVGQRVIIPTSARPLSPEVRRSLETPVRLGRASSGSGHTVRKGETLGSIAAHYEVSVSDLERWNHLKPGAPLAAGKRLRVSGSTASRVPASSPGARSPGAARPATHVVRPGETLSGVAKKYGVPVSALRQANGMGPKDVLKAGMTIRIPG
ncbi:MAG TPA: LysM peptidoglycan-binding domain-containing protein [Gemmatimonadales bacterium]|nr:LysM peptidoglycan-binding domain-containing protein [Gemmatimonadales bacterium]